MTASDTSKATFVDPNSVFHVEDTARTNDSPGSIATSARTSVYTPNPRITHPISRRLNAIVNCPSVNGKFRLSTYGIDEIGDVPRSALVIRLTPSELMKSPIRNTMYRFSFSIFGSILS